MTVVPNHTIFHAPSVLALRVRHIIGKDVHQNDANSNDTIDRLTKYLLCHSGSLDSLSRKAPVDNHYSVYLFGVLSDSHLRSSVRQILGSLLLDACHFGIQPRYTHGTWY